MESSSTTEKRVSKYTFLTTPAGFLIQREGGLQQSIEYRDYGLAVDANLYPLYPYKVALQEVAEYFAGHLVRGRRMVDEATEMIARALHTRFYEHWKVLVKTLVPLDVEKLARLVWSSNQKGLALVRQPELYNDDWRYVRGDLEKYHACRLLAQWLEEQGKRGAEALQILTTWRDRLSPIKPNKAVNKTLDKLPVGVSFKHIARLSTIRLEHPVTERLHLIFILAASDHHNFGLHERAVVTANAQAVKEAAHIIGQTLTARSKTVAIQSVGRHILDYPEAYHGDLVGLARRSFEWHGQLGNYPRYESSLPEDYLLPAPQIDFAELDYAGVHFLNTAGDVYDEGHKMRHCVGSYATKAAHGECYLFHVDHEGEQATIEVSPVGIVLQACGPENMRNQACSYGAKALEQAFRDKTKGGLHV